MVRNKKENPQTRNVKPSKEKTPELPKTAKKAAKTSKKPAKDAIKISKTKKPVKTAATEKSPVKPKTAAVKKRVRKAHVTRPTVKEEFLIGQRRLRVLELKISGASVRRISALLQSEGFKHCSPATVQSDLDAMLDKISDEESLGAERWRTLMIERNEDQFFRVKSSMITEVSVKNPANNETVTERRMVSDPEKENVLIRNLTFLDKLVGASKAEQSKNRANEALAKLIGVSPDELGDDPDNSDKDDDGDG